MSDRGVLLPELLELDDFRRSVNRKMWVVIGLLGVVTLAALLLALIALARPIPVVAFDSEGHPVLFSDTVTPGRKMENIRVEVFAKDFLEHWTCIDSANVTDDFTAAVNMMTPRYRKIVLSDTDELARREQRSDLNVKARLATFETKIGPYGEQDPAAKIYVIASGKMRFVPKFPGTLEGSETFKYYFTELALQRVPVTKETIHGLLVDYAHTRLFDTEEAMNVYALKRQ